MDKEKLNVIRKINKNIVHKDGTIDSFEKQLIQLMSGVFDTKYPLVISDSTTSLEYIEDFNKENPLVMNVSTVIKLREKHDIGYEFVSNCEMYLKESVLAFDSYQHDTSKIILLDQVDDDGFPMIAICRENKPYSREVLLNEITSIYDKKNLENMIIKSYQENNTFYKNEKTERYMNSIGFQFPQDVTYALSNSYDSATFTKSQVEQDLKQKLYDEKYVFDDDLYILDEKAETINAYLCITSLIAEEFEEYTGESMEDIENVNLYADFNVKRNTLELSGTYYKGNEQFEYKLEQTDEENSVLKDKLEEYCREKEGMSCLDYVNSVREEEGMKLIEREDEREK